MQLASGDTVTADVVYIRESILNPQAKIVAGYQPMMPTFQGQVTEEQLLALTEYINGLPSPPADPRQRCGARPRRRHRPDAGRDAIGSRNEAMRHSPRRPRRYSQPATI